MHKKLLAIMFATVLGVSACAPSTPPAVQEEAVPEEIETVEEEAVEVDETATSYKLAAVDNRLGDAGLYEQRFQQVLERCPNNEESRLGDALYQATQILDDRGITEDSLWAMETLLNAIPPSEAGTLDCPEVLALGVALRIEEG